MHDVTLQSPRALIRVMPSLRVCEDVRSRAILSRKHYSLNICDSQASLSCSWP